MGDPNQLAPIKEVLSKVFALRSTRELSEVHRYAGLLLKMATEAIDGGSLETLIDRYCALQDELSEDELPKLEDGTSYRPIEVLGFRDSVGAMVELIQAGEDAVWLTCTNKEARRVNVAVQQALKGSESLDYRVGDHLVAITPVTRGEYDECRATRKARIVVPNSEIITISRIQQVPKSGVWQYYMADCVLADNQVISEQIKLLDPNQLGDWELEVDRLARRASAFSNTPRKAKNGRSSKADLATFALWEELGLLDWHTRKGGRSFSPAEKNMLRKRAWSEYFTLKQSHDDVFYCHAMTDRKAQGSGFPTVFVSLSDTFSRRIPNYGAGTDWDQRKHLYTIITRAEMQVVGVR